MEQSIEFVFKAEEKLQMSRKFQPGSEMLLDPPDWAVLLWFHAKCLHLWLTCDSHSQCKARVKGPAKGSDFKKLLSEVLPAKREGWSFLFKRVTHGCLGNFSSESPMGQPLQSRWHHGPQAVKQLLLSMSRALSWLFSANLSYLLWGCGPDLSLHCCTSPALPGRASSSERWMSY